MYTDDFSPSSDSGFCVKAKTVVHSSRAGQRGCLCLLIYVPSFQTGMHFKPADLIGRNHFEAGSPKKVIFTLDPVHLGGPVGLWSLWQTRSQKRHVCLKCTSGGYSVVLVQAEDEQRWNITTSCSLFSPSQILLPSHFYTRRPAQRAVCSRTMQLCTHTTAQSVNITRSLY